jgi:hypothetical protein
VKEYDMGGTCSTHGEKINVYKIVVGRPEREEA